MNTRLDAERHQWIAWIPCALALGVGIFFSLWSPTTTMPMATTIAIGTGLVGGTFILVKKQASCIMVFCAWGIVWASIGFMACMVRVYYVRTNPVVQPVPAHWMTGVIESIDHPTSKTKVFQRVVIRINRLRYPDLPHKAMITVRTTCQPLYVGQTIRLKAALFPVQGACLPLAYNHRTVCYFKGVGATGFAVSRPTVVDPGQWTWHNIRHTTTRTIYAKMPHHIAPLACGLITGDKAGLSPTVRDAFGQSGLSHLLAISGLHISSLSSLVFYACRRIMAQWTWLALAINIDRLCGVVSIGVTMAYLFISGQSVSAVRAFVMSASSVTALIVLRKYNAMRTLMVCASLFLLVQPESLLSLSYQMSFLAVLGLLSFSRHRRAHASTRTVHMAAQATGHLAHHGRAVKKTTQKRTSLVHRCHRFVAQSFVSTSVATFSLASITAFHFSTIPLQGLCANLVAIPLTTLFIMPLGFVSMLCMRTPILSDWLFAVWTKSLNALVHIAQWSAYGLSALSFDVPRCHVGWFICQMIGMFWLFIWQQKWKWWGLVLWVGAAVAGYTFHCSYPILVDPAHRLVGVADHANGTLYISSPRRGKWTAKKWAKALKTPAVRVLRPHMPLPTYPDWTIHVTDDAKGIRIHFSHKDVQRSWSSHVPPFGSVYVACPLRPTPTKRPSTA